MAATSTPTHCPPIVFLLHQVVASPEGHQMGVVGGGGDGDRAGTSHVGVAQLVGQDLELVGVEAVVIP